MDLYNTKLLLACPKQTLNSVWTPEMANQAMKGLAALTAAITMAIAEKVDSLFLHL